MTHKGNKPYQCIYCEKYFPLKTNLITHTRTHIGEKPYHCIQCDKAFVQSNEMKSHLRTHTGENPYLCSQCGKAFVRNGTQNQKKTLFSAAQGSLVAQRVTHVPWGGLF